VQPVSLVWGGEVQTDNLGTQEALGVLPGPADAPPTGHDHW
jgi:hypothetical protein